MNGTESNETGEKRFGERMQPRGGYQSDSGMSDQAASTSGPVQRGVTKRKADMRGSTDLYTEVRPSILSAERITITQHSGILNLMVIVLLATNTRLILENLLKYGILTHPTRWIFFLFSDSSLLLFCCWPVMALQAFVALGIENLGKQRLKSEKKSSVAKRKKNLSPADARRLAASMGKRSEALLAMFNTVNIISVLLIPSLVISLTIAEPLPGGSVIFMAMVLWMKLVSYAHCNADLRRDYRYKMLFKEDDSSATSKYSGFDAATSIPQTIPADGEVTHMRKVHYPDNLGLGNLAYFLIAPTLVYQPSYPHSTSIRPKWLLWYILRLLAVIGTGLIITEQYIEPTIANSIVPLAELNWARIAERMLKLSIPTFYGWVIIFYALFHVWLNILAEITYFGDREFYKDWWNATTIGDYWRLWNVPVHKWLLRHVYFPCIHAKMPKTLAACCVFFVSAIAHELIVGIPLHMVRFWAFSGLMFQVPLLFLTEYIKNKSKSDTIGNFVFWFSFVIYGQPMAVMLYYHDYVLLHRPEWLEDLKARAALQTIGQKFA